MARTTPGAVRTRLANDYDGQADLRSPIRSANLLTTRLATAAAARARPLTDDELEDIERYLACHFYCVSDRPVTSTSTAGAQETYQGTTAMNLQSTHYGQAALTMDVSGCLATLTSQRKRVRIGWLGTKPDDQAAYEDR